MKKHYYPLVTIFFFFMLLPNMIYAECTADDRRNFREVEEEYKITYEFNKETKDFTITTHSPLPDDFDFIIYVGKDVNYEEITPNEFKFYNIPPGTYDVSIVGQTEECNSELKKMTLTLPEYNNYADDPLCEGIEEFVLCQPTYDKLVTYEEFVERVNIYKKTKTKKNEEEKTKNKSAIIEYITEHLFQIIAITVFAIVLIVTAIITIKSIRKSRRLE